MTFNSNNLKDIELKKRKKAYRFSKKYSLLLIQEPQFTLDELRDYLIEPILSAPSLEITISEKRILLPYLQYHLLLGYTKDEMINKLISEGWNKDWIKHATNQVTYEKPNSRHKEHPFTSIQMDIRDICVQIIGGYYINKIVAKLNELMWGEKISLRLIELAKLFLKKVKFR